MAVTDKVGQVVLYLVRHAEVTKDKEGKIRGLLNDSLNDKGHKQASEIADLFDGKEIRAAYTDDLKRTQQTLQPVAASKGLEIKVDPELRSWDVGSDLEGKSIEANDDEIKRLKSQPWLVPVGGKSWESYLQQIRSAFSRYWQMGLENGPILLVVHGSGLQVIWDMLGAMELSAEYDRTPLDNSGVAAVYQTRQGPKLKVLRGANPGIDE